MGVHGSVVLTGAVGVLVLVGAGRGNDGVVVIAVV